MLCLECERRFSTAENYFATQIFRPILSGVVDLRYDSRLMYFLVSVLWRLTQVSLPKARTDGNRFLDRIEAAESEWRQFLLGIGELWDFAHVHLFVFDISPNPPGAAKGFNVYCARALDGTFVNNKTSSYVYAKFARFLCTAVLTPYHEADWVNTRIVNGAGTLSIPQEIRDTFIGNFILHRADTIAEIFDTQLSVRQHKVIEDHVFKNADAVANSDLARAAFADYESQEAFMASLPKVGRNEKCPCGSGVKFKNCHGKASSKSR